MGKRTDICAAGLGLALCFLPTSSFAHTIDGSKEAIERFTAEQVFNLEYGDDPQISPDARTIIYVRRSMDAVKDVIRGDIWSLDTISGKHRPLISGGASASAPRWSPDGSQFLYTASQNKKHDLRVHFMDCLLYTSPSPRDATLSRMPSSA